MDYLYDGSFDGLLTCIYLSYYQEPADGIFRQESYQYNLLRASQLVETNQVMADKVYEAVSKKISPQALKNIYYAFLSSVQNKETLIYHYIRLGFKIGKDIDLCHTHPSVLPIQNIVKKVGIETHRFYGLLRFSDTGRFLYAELEPDHNILILLADHFSNRLAGENFIICDKQRKQAVIYDQTEWYITDFQPVDLVLSENESYYQKLWSEYFAKIGIEKRANIRLQTQFVPQRYRKNITEFKNSLLNND